VKKYLTIAISFIIVLLSGASYSAERTDIDVVLVMDSTGSMKKTDPLSLRMPAAKMFISLLGKNDRAGVIRFSDSAEVLNPLTLLDSGDGKNILFQAIDGITSTGPHTNLYEAVYKGLEVISKEKPTGRGQIIVQQ
jgi:Ca-activated chloride channel family protein